MSDVFVYLASQSPRRAQLLEQIGIRYELLAPDAGEDVEALEAPLEDERPERYVRRVTALKLDAALQRLARRGLPPAPVLCADTTVALGKQILGKPAHAADAARILAKLSGRTHRVLTAVAVAGGTARGLSVSDSRVRFARLRREQIETYAASGEPLGKAGAYAIQGAAAAFVVRIAGSYSGIMGLPLYETARLVAACSKKS